MLTIVQRGGATHEKPPEAVRGYSSRLPWAWDSLCFAVPLNDATRDGARDLVYNVAPSAFVGTPVWTRDNRGNTALYLDAASYVDYPDTAAHNKALTEITACVRFRRVGTGDIPGGLVGKRYGPPGDPPEFSWVIQHSDTGDNTLGAGIGIMPGQIYWEAPGYVVPTTEWVTAFMQWRSSENPTLTLFGEHGQILTSAPYPLGPGYVSGTIVYKAGEPLRLNAIHPGMEYNCEYSQALMWSRKLGGAEVQALVADPYGWYSPRRATVITSSPYVLPFGGGEMHGAGGMGGMY